jgi:8-demethyl-8-(2-methoxy-alpha-L-rhamnosyl)tetracenomycin-C 3'-O-methyltransferase
MLKYGSDKASDGHNYTPVYEQLFEPLRDRPVALLELGVAYGASLRTWAEYFTHPDAVIVGIDNGISAVDLPARVSKYTADQTEIPAELEGWCPDIIIDDASHLSSKTIGSLRTWFPILKPGGIYAVEDVTTSYDAVFSGHDEASEDPDRGPRIGLGAQTAMQFLKRLADEVESFALKSEFRLGFDVESLCFHRDLVVVHKGLGQSTAGYVAQRWGVPTYRRVGDPQVGTYRVL